MRRSDSLRDGETFYAHNLGLPELRAAIAGYVGALHRPIGPERIAVTSSGVNALMLAMQTLVGAGDEVVAVVPVWPNLTAQPEILGARVTRVPLRPEAGAWQLDLDELLAAVTPEHARPARQRAEQPDRLDADARRAAGDRRALPAHRHLDRRRRGLRAHLLLGRARAGAELPRRRCTGRSADRDPQLLEELPDDRLAARLDGAARSRSPNRSAS